MGYQNKEEALNKHPASLSPEYQSDGQESIIKGKEMLASTLSKGWHQFEWNHKRSNGEVFDVDVLLTRLVLGDRTIIY